jgi:CHAD domain-containing protein
MFVTSRCHVEGVRVIEVTPWLTELVTYRALVRERAEPEDVHQLRVATRRVASWLRLGRSQVLRDDLGWLRRVAGAVRDADVVLEMEPDDGWSQWLREVRRTRGAELAAAISGERTDALLVALAGLPALERATAGTSLRRLARRVLAASDQLEAEPEDLERFHRLRRAVRGLRYGLVWLDEKTSAFRQFQEISGLAADRSLALRLLDEYPRAAALAGRRAELVRGLDLHRRAAIGAWADLRDRVMELA